jgi:hypothetical protein
MNVSITELATTIRTRFEDKAGGEVVDDIEKSSVLAILKSSF